MSWTIAPCSYDDAAALAAELGVSETTARVLARRGLGDPTTARRFLEGAPPRHDPFLLGNMAAAREAMVTEPVRLLGRFVELYARA